MSWTRGFLAALAVCVLLPAGLAGCGSSAGSEQGDGKNGASTAPAGKLLDDTDEAGRRYREVGGKGAPWVGVQVEPDSDGSWEVRLTLRNFRFSPQGSAARAVEGRGAARLYVDDKPLAELRTPRYRIGAGYLPHGTHHVTARLYADDGTVWAVDGKMVQSTADITASEPEASPGAGSPSPSEPVSGSASPTGVALGTGGRGTGDTAAGSGAGAGVGLAAGWTGVGAVGAGVGRGASGLPATASGTPFPTAAVASYPYPPYASLAVETPFLPPTGSPRSLSGTTAVASSVLSREFAA
ncbi:nuclear transport factor 2 family protein [Streptomyces niveiscabiei]|uniref:nuclear transport factor 2 family protein n=1 Tax=Streptomyces niveiscabiei TaxID=164115 RepID=UPI0029BE19E2|nr:nuclear transport factor 2 family protein [Streptomyces niveiscabiei]MDX3386898.1 nuclear transport factor 2 family protein [Streptomyces niveiscabiei]